MKNRGANGKQYYGVLGCEELESIEERSEGELDSLKSLSLIKKSIDKHITTTHIRILFSQLFVPAR